MENEDLIRYVYPPCHSECLYAAVEFAPIGFRIHFHELFSFLSELSFICLYFIYRNMANSQSECVPAANPKKWQSFVMYFIFV